MTKIYIFLIALYALFTIVLLSGHFVPRSFIKKNIQTSYEIMNDQGLYAEGLDTFTDALFLNAAITRYDGNILNEHLVMHIH